MTLKKLTKEQAVTLHRAYWNYIADNKLLTKPLIFTFEDELINVEEEIEDSCFCCEYAFQYCLEKHGRQYFIENGICKHCPIVWPNGRCTYGTSDQLGLYTKWYCGKTEDVDTAKVARQIANLPESII